MPAGPGIPRHCPGYFKSCVLISRGPDVKTCGHQHIAYECTDVPLAYSVVTKYTFRNCASQMRHSQLLPRYSHSSAGAYGVDALSWVGTLLQVTVIKWWTLTYVLCYIWGGHRILLVLAWECGIRFVNYSSVSSFEIYKDIIVYSLMCWSMEVYFHKSTLSWI